MFPLQLSLPSLLLWYHQHLPCLLTLPPKNVLSFAREIVNATPVMRRIA
jgi:hypothetical protein